MGVTKNTKSVKLQPVTEKLDNVGFLVSACYEWTLKKGEVNDYDTELENYNLFVARFEKELKRAERNVLYKMDKIILMLTYMFFILDYCVNEDSTPFFTGIVAPLGKSSNWYINRDTLCNLASCASPYARVVSIR